MLLDEFLIAIKTVAETAGILKVKDSLDATADASENLDKSIASSTSAISESFNDSSNASQNLGDSVKKTGSTIASSFSKALTIVGAFVTTIKTGLMSAWAFFDGTIDRIEELQKSEDESIRTTAEQVEMSKKYRENMEKMGKTIDNVKTRIAIAFLPAMYEMSKVYSEFLEKNKDLIENGIKKVLEWVTRLSQVITNFARFVDLAIEKTIGWKGALMVLGAALLWINRAMILAFATNPITWIVAAIAGLLLLIDDFMTYLDGGESLFGDFWGSLIGWIEKVKAPLTALKNAFTGAFDAISDAFDTFISIFSENFNISDIFGFDEVAKEGEESKSFFVSFLELLTDFFKFIENNKEKIKSVAEFMGKAFAIAAELVIGVFSGLGQAIGGFVSYALNLFDLIVAVFTGDTQAMADAWQGMCDAASSFLDGLLNVIGQIVKSILDMFGTTIDAVVNKFSSLVSSASSAVSSIGTVFAGVFDLITAPFAKAFDWVSDKLGSLGSMAANAIKGITSGVSSAAGGISNAVGGAISNNNKTVNNYGGNVDAKINVTSSSPQQAANKTVQGLSNANAFANRNLKGGAKA